VKEFLPKTVLLENVPGLGRDSRLTQLLAEIVALGYVARKYLVQATDFGVPQRRKRLIVMAVRGGTPGMFPDDLTSLLSAEFDKAPVTAGAALDSLAGQLLHDDPLNRSRTHSAKTTERIAAIPVNGNRFDLPLDLRLACHTRLEERGLKTATSPYGRVQRDKPAPTMTTRCTSPSCGSFVHPTKNRGLTLREAAAFQTFPPSYAFSGNYGEIERQIGNAVPVRLAHGLGLVMAHFVSSVAPVTDMTEASAIAAS